MAKTHKRKFKDHAPASAAEHDIEGASTQIVVRFVDEDGGRGIEPDESAAAGAAAGAGPPPVRTRPADAVAGPDAAADGSTQPSPRRLGEGWGC